MDSENFMKLILSGASISFGALLGVLRSKIFASKENNKLHYIFYSFSILILLLSIPGAIIYKKDLNAFNTTVIISAIIFSALLFLATNKFLIFKNVFKTKALDPIVNKFTANADKNDIRLFGGDLNFFGNSTQEIDVNKQYTHLRSLEFKKISILCETPHTQLQRIRYGKILSEMPYVQLRFYEPAIADLKVRGRIIQVQGIIKLLMYTKIKDGLYQSIETDTANSSGALYNNIWELAWALASTPTPSEIQNYISLFNGND